uniref:head GIN domain-containing protein n=1 Tax=Flavobacterium sp. TaxID=239 RepID=UPI0040492CDA
MKNCIFLFLFSFFILPLTAQTVTKNPGDFDTVRVFDQMNVTLIPSDQTKVEIKGIHAKEVQMIIKNGELTLRLPLLKLLQGEAVEAIVYYKNLAGLEVNEGSFVSATTQIESIGFNLNVKEGAEVSLQLKTSKTKISIASGGILKLKGSTDNQDIVMKAGGELEAENFISKQTTISLNAGGSAHIYATEYVDAKVRAGGTIYIHGKPKQIDQKTVIAGEIIQVN